MFHRHILLTWLLSIVLKDIAPQEVSTSCQYDFSGARDVIFLFDTSMSVNNASLIQGKKIARDMIRSAMLVQPDKVRLAVLTFSASAEVKFNFISGQDTHLYECELFSPGGLWDTSVQFLWETGENLEGGLTKASEIFSEGIKIRNQVKQDLVIISDAHELFKDISRANSITGMRSDMMRYNISIYGMGVGGMLNENEFQYRIVSDPVKYRPAKDWSHAVCTGDKGNILNGGYKGVWRRVHDANICQPFCDNVERFCSCQEFSDVTFPLTRAQCMVMDGDDVVSGDDDDTAQESSFWRWKVMLFLFFGLCGTFALIALISGILWCRNWVKDITMPIRHIERAMSSNNEDHQSNAYIHQKSHQRRQEEMYQNGIVATVLAGHSLERPPNTGQGVSGQARRTRQLPPIPQGEDSRAYDYVVSEGRPGDVAAGEESPYVHIHTPDMMNTPELRSNRRHLGGINDHQGYLTESSGENNERGEMEYINSGVLHALQRRFKKMSKKLGSGRSGASSPSPSSSQPSAMQNAWGGGAGSEISEASSAKSRRSWRDLFRSSRQDSSIPETENTDVRQVQQPGTSGASKASRLSVWYRVGTQKFRNLRGMFETRKHPVMGMTRPAAEQMQVGNHGQEFESFRHTTGLASNVM